MRLFGFKNSSLHGGLSDGFWGAGTFCIVQEKAWFDLCLPPGEVVAQSFFVEAERHAGDSTRGHVQSCF